MALLHPPALDILIPAACMTAASTRRSWQTFVADAPLPSRLFMVVSRPSHPALSFQYKLDVFLSKSGRMLMQL